MKRAEYGLDQKVLEELEEELKALKGNAYTQDSAEKDRESVADDLTKLTRMAAELANLCIESRLDGRRTEYVMEVYVRHSGITYQIAHH